MAKRPLSYLAGTVVLGSVIGAVVGLLAAPTAGRETRSFLLKHSSEAFKRLAGRIKGAKAPDVSLLKKLPARLRRKRGGADASSETVEVGTQQEP